MTIRPVVLNGMIQRTQDVGNLKQQEDNKPAVQQHNIEIRQEKQEERLLHQVQHSEQKENEGYRYDAKEKGNNQYEGNSKKKKKKSGPDHEPSKDGKVVLKSQGSSFDMKI
ncbi:MAG: hypothetical protein ACLT3H_10860 [Roseburia sp.]